MKFLQVVQGCSRLTRIHNNDTQAQAVLEIEELATIACYCYNLDLSEHFICKCLDWNVWIGVSLK